MNRNTFFGSLLLAALAGCSDPAPLTADATVDVAPADVPTGDRPDASFRCPAESLDALFSRSCAGLEGTECRYGYTVPACGGRTQTCRAGRWEEIHTDPQAACFDAGRD